MLSNFKWYRKLVGGAWYLVHIPAVGEPTFWTQRPTQADRVIQAEEY